VEVLLAEETAPGVWEGLLRARRAAPGLRLVLAGGQVRAEVLRTGNGGRVTLALRHERPILDILDAEGVPPLPPYIKRDPNDLAARGADRARYQTVYARRPGAVAAPTAGLHFTEPLLGALAQRGIRRAAVTLHVGPGTFKPVTAGRVEDHCVDAERFAVPAETAAAVQAARAAGGRVAAVGSTVVRALETAADAQGEVAAAEGRSALFIYPPYAFRAVDVLLTNFHLPRSSLLMMVCAFAGRERVLRAYAEAIRAGYRFYSYGDCMLIL